MEKKLKDLTIEEFMPVLADATGAPGGGSMCALAGAIGTSGLIMVADLTASLKRFAHEAPLCTEVSTEAKKYLPLFVVGIDHDTDCYNEIIAAVRLPKSTDEEKAVRKAAMADATLKATEAPYQVLCNSVKVLQLCSKLNGHYNPAAASDFAASVLQLQMAAKTAWHNILANLGGIADKERAEFLRANGTTLHCKAMELCDTLVSAAEKYLNE